MKVLKIISAALTLAIFCALTACDDSYDDAYSYYYSTQFGTLTKNGRNYYLSLDDEKKSLQVSDSSAIVRAGITHFPQRILAYYSDLSLSASGTGTVNLLQVNPVLTQSLSPAPANEEERKELGTSPVYVTWAWFGGGYLNVQFRYPYYSSADEAHSFTVYYAGISSDGYAVYEMRHQATTGEIKEWSPVTYASFELPYYGSEGQNGLGGNIQGAILRYVDTNGVIEYSGERISYVNIDLGTYCQVLE